MKSLIFVKQRSMILGESTSALKSFFPLPFRQVNELLDKGLCVCSIFILSFVRIKYLTWVLCIQVMILFLLLNSSQNKQLISIFTLAFFKSLLRDVANQRTHRTTSSEKWTASHKVQIEKLFIYIDFHVGKTSLA